MSFSGLQRSRSRRASRICFETLEDRRLMSFSTAVNYAAGAAPQEVVTVPPGTPAGKREGGATP